MLVSGVCVAQRSRASAGIIKNYPDSKVNGTNMEPTWDRQVPGGPHVGPTNLSIWVGFPK